MWIPVAVEAIVAVLLTGYLIFYYGSLKYMQWYTFLTTFIGWLFAFSIIFLLPNDMSAALYKTCLNMTEEIINNTGSLPPGPPCVEPLSLVIDSFLYYVWEANYWTAFVLSWAWCPLLQSYVLAGGFTFWQKAWQSIKENLILYSVLLVLGIGVLIYIGVTQQFDLNAMMGVVMALANAYGLIFVSCFLGYGLVEIPRYMWFLSKPELVLRYQEFKASSTKDNVDDCSLDLVDVIRKINGLDKNISMQHEFRKYVDVMVKKCPSDREKYGVDNENVSNITVKQLMNLNAQITEAARYKIRADVLWHQLLVEAFHQSDIIANKKSSNRMFTSTLFKKQARTTRQQIARAIEWYWKCMFVPVLFKILAVCCALLSIIIVWCEVTIFSENPVLSVINIMMHSKLSSFGLYTLTFIILGYMCVCTYSSLLKIRLFNYYYLVGNHQTDENSLLFAAAYLSRLTFPLSYNFSMIAGVDGTVFSQVLGKMDMLPIFGLQFNTYFPIIVAVICFLFIFNIPGRLMALCNIEKFRFDEDFKDANIEDGSELVADARARSERHPDLFFSGVTELPADRNSWRQKRKNETDSIHDDDSGELNNTNRFGVIGGFFSKFQSKTSPSSSSSSSFNKGKRPILPTSSGSSSKTSGFLKSSDKKGKNKSRNKGFKGVVDDDDDDVQPLSLNSGNININEDDNEIEDLLRIDPIVKPNTFRRGRPNSNMFSDV